MKMEAGVGSWDRARAHVKVVTGGWYFGIGRVTITFLSDHDVDGDV